MRSIIPLKSIRDLILSRGPLSRDRQRPAHAESQIAVLRLLIRGEAISAACDGVAAQASITAVKAVIHLPADFML